MYTEAPIEHRTSGGSVADVVNRSDEGSGSQG